MRRRLAITAAAVACAALLAGCDFDKATEPYKDAPIGATNSAAADTITFPDGFSNVATKCDHGNRVYVAFKGDQNRAALAVVANDPTCGGNR